MPVSLPAATCCCDDSMTRVPRWRARGPWRSCQGANRLMGREPTASASAGGPPAEPDLIARVSRGPWRNPSAAWFRRMGPIRAPGCRASVRACRSGCGIWCRRPRGAAWQIGYGPTGRSVTARAALEPLATGRTVQLAARWEAGTGRARCARCTPRVVAGWFWPGWQVSMRSAEKTLSNRRALCLKRASRYVERRQDDARARDTNR